MPSARGHNSFPKGVGGRTDVAAGTWWICALLMLATVLNYLDRHFPERLPAASTRNRLSQVKTRDCSGFSEMIISVYSLRCTD
jgi:hypothetical protein